MSESVILPPPIPATSQMHSQDFLLRCLFVRAFHPIPFPRSRLPFSLPVQCSRRDRPVGQKNAPPRERTDGVVIWLTVLVGVQEEGLRKD